MATTTNFGWETPDDTDPVYQGAAAMRTLGNSIDTSLVDLKGGTTGQVLSKNSNTDLDFTWVAQDDSNAIQNAIVDAKGDLISATAADTPARLPVGTDGQVLTAASGESTGLKWATPSTGLNWTPRLAASNAFYEIAYNGSNLYVAVGSSGNLYTSPDALTWTSRTSGFGANSIYGVGYGNGLFVAVGQNGTITTSTDGITWTARTSNMGTANIQSVIYANSTWVAVGANGGTLNTGGITYSSDGLTWTRKSQSVSVGSDYYDVVYNGTNWIVVANIATNNYLYASTPSGTWTVGATGSGGDIFHISWDGTRHLTVEGGSYSSRYSTSTTLGTTTAYANTHQGEQQLPANYFYYSNKMYISNTRYFGYYVPASSSAVLNYGPYFLPVPTRSTTPFLQGGTGCIFVGSAGIISASSFGIFTSF